VAAGASLVAWAPAGGAPRRTWASACGGAVAGPVGLVRLPVCRRQTAVADAARRWCHRPLVVGHHRRRHRLHRCLPHIQRVAVADAVAVTASVR